MKNIGLVLAFIVLSCNTGKQEGKSEASPVAALTVAKVPTYSFDEFEAVSYTHLTLPTICSV